MARSGEPPQDICFSNVMFRYFRGELCHLKAAGAIFAMSSPYGGKSRIFFVHSGDYGSQWKRFFYLPSTVFPFSS